MSKLDEIVDEFYIEQLQRPVNGITRDEFRAALVRAAEPQWVRVSERLPDETVKEVISFDAEEKSMHITEFPHGWGDMLHYPWITHWQPLPSAPPTEQKGNDL